MSRAISRSANYTRRFYLARERNLQKVKHIKQTLEQESHLFIVMMGAVIGSIFSLFILVNYFCACKTWHIELGIILIKIVDFIYIDFS